jgi:hypothetical protein
MLSIGINGRYTSSTFSVVADVLVEGPAPPEVDAFIVQE